MTAATHEVVSMRRGDLEYAIAIASGGSDQDRAAVVPFGHGLVVVLADGVGGTANGGPAADAVVGAAIRDPAACVDAASLLYALDDPEQLRGGQTTAVIVVVRDDGLTGASVGDSGAWIIERDGIVELTAQQRRRPFLGDGCTPVPFSNHMPPGAILLVASDGLFSYAKRADIARVAREHPIEQAATALIELVRMRSGALQDDMSIVLCRRCESHV